MSYRLQLQLASRIRTVLVPSWSCSQAVSKPVWHLPLLCVQWKTAVGGQRNCPKHVEFHSKNKFEKLVHLVGFIIRIFQDARSPERQILWYVSCLTQIILRKPYIKQHIKHRLIIKLITILVIKPNRAVSFICLPQDVSEIVYTFCLFVNWNLIFFN